MQRRPTIGPGSQRPFREQPLPGTFSNWLRVQHYKGGKIRDGQGTGMCRGAVVRGEDRGWRGDCTCPAATRGYASLGKQPLSAGCRHGLVPRICTLIRPKGVDRTSCGHWGSFVYLGCVTVLCNLTGGPPSLLVCVCVRGNGRTYNQDSITRHTSKKQGQGIQARCTTRTQNNNDNNQQ